MTVHLSLLPRKHPSRHCSRIDPRKNSNSPFIARERTYEVSWPMAKHWAVSLATSDCRNESRIPQKGNSIICRQSLCQLLASTSKRTLHKFNNSKKGRFRCGTSLFLHCKSLPDAADCCCSFALPSLSANGTAVPSSALLLPSSEACPSVCCDPGRTLLQHFDLLLKVHFIETCHNLILRNEDPVSRGRH